MSEEDEDEVERHFTILYGSETGNSQDVAERIARQARRRRIGTSVYSMDDYDIVSWHTSFKEDLSPLTPDDDSSPS